MEGKRCFSISWGIWHKRRTNSYRVLIKYCVFSMILIYIPDTVFSRCQCVYTHQAGRTPALQQNWQSSENSKNVRKYTIFNEHPVALWTFHNFWLKICMEIVCRDSYCYLSLSVCFNVTPCSYSFNFLKF